MTMRHVAASGVAGFLIILMPLCEADAGIWCPTPIPGVLMKYCLCESITGSLCSLQICLLREGETSAMLSALLLRRGLLQLLVSI